MSVAALLLNSVFFYLLGDMNLDVSRPEARGVRLYLQLLDELQLHQLIREPTHPCPTPTTLDHVITNMPPERSSTSVVDDDISDHLPIIVNTAVPKPRRVARTYTCRPWHRADWDALCLDLLLSDWTEFDGATDVNELLDIFMRIWNSSADKHCPERSVRTRRPHCPWVQDVLPELREAIVAKNTARADWQAFGQPDDKALYVSLKKQVSSILITAHRNFNCQQLLSNDFRGFWNTMRKFSLSSGSVSEPDDVTVPDPDVLNEFFSTVGSRVAAGVSVSDREPRPVRPARVCATLFQLTPVTLTELSAAVRDMKSSGAVGVDGIPLLAVRRCWPVIGPRLLCIVNASLVSGVFPSAWKTACVLPIFKSGDRTVPSNFRPISLLSVLSKATEKVVCNQLVSYLVCNSILADSQYAYRPSHSTEDALIDAVTWVSNNTDQGLLSSITTVDLSKAFDSVDHGVLIEKLAWCGVPSHWFESYLTDRRQMVRGGTSTLPVTHGVPQGSLVGPVLFSVLTNDMANFIPFGKIISYADDTNILDRAHPTDDSLSDLKDRVEDSLSALERWFSQNSLKMNATKTNFMIIGTKQSVKNHSSHLTLRVSGSQVQPSQTMKILGVTLDQTLSWDSHISNVVGKCFGSLISLNRFRHHFTPAALQLIIQAHVLSHITYCLPVWGGARKTQQARVQKVLNFAARVITGKRKRDHISPAMRSLEWPTFQEMVTERDLINVHRAVHDGRAPAALRSLFVQRNRVSVRNTRAHERCLQLPRCKLEATKRSFAYRAASGWNALPASALECPTRGAFKAQLRRRRKEDT